MKVMGTCYMRNEGEELRQMWLLEEEDVIQRGKKTRIVIIAEEKLRYTVRDEVEIIE